MDPLSVFLWRTEWINKGLTPGDYCGLPKEDGRNCYIPGADQLKKWSMLPPSCLMQCGERSKYGNEKLDMLDAIWITLMGAEKKCHGEFIQRIRDSHRYAMQTIADYFVWLKVQSEYHPGEEVWATDVSWEECEDHLRGSRRDFPEILL